MTHTQDPTLSLIQGWMVNQQAKRTLEQSIGGNEDIIRVVIEVDQKSKHK